MKFKREKLTGLGGDTEVWFTAEGQDAAHDGFCLVASGEGIRLQGRSPLLRDQAELSAFAEVVSKAWAEHHKLRPKLLAPNH